MPRRCCCKSRYWRLRPAPSQPLPRRPGLLLAPGPPRQTSPENDVPHLEALVSAACHRSEPCASAVSASRVRASARLCPQEGRIALTEAQLRDLPASLFHQVGRGPAAPPSGLTSPPTGPRPRVSSPPGLSTIGLVRFGPCMFFSCPAI